MNRSLIVEALVVAVGSLCLTPVTTMAQQATEPKPNVVDVPSKAVEIPDKPAAINPASVVHESLAKNATVDFVESSLSDVADWLKNETKMHVVLDRRSLEAADILTSEPVVDRLTDEPIYLLLDRLRHIGVGWRLVDDIIQLDAADDEFVYTKQYNVGDLFDAGHDPQKLRSAIEHGVATQSWESAGGSGVTVLLGDVMFVRQSAHVHHRVAGLLAAIRTHARRTLIFDPPQHDQLRMALNVSIDAKFRSMPLVTVAQRLANLSQIDLRLDRRSLQAMGIRDRMPIDIDIEQQSLRLVLDLLSQQYDLAWHINDGALWITTPEAVVPTTAVFDVRDLCRDQLESMALSEAVQSQAIPEEWEDLGGIGTIQFPLARCMVVHQTERGLNDVLQLLDNYRTALRASKPRERKVDDPLSTQYYRMPTNVAKDLANALPKMIKPHTWQMGNNNKAAGTILRLESWADAPSIAGAAQIPHSVLVIHQSRTAHESITRTLHKLQHGEQISMMPSSNGGLGGGGGGFGGGFFRIGEE